MAVLDDDSSKSWDEKIYTRDKRIGWNPAMRAARLKLVVSNRRYTELVAKGSRQNLASQVLGMAIGPSGWQGGEDFSETSGWEWGTANG